MPEEKDSEANRIEIEELPIADTELKEEDLKDIKGGASGAGMFYKPKNTGGNIVPGPLPPFGPFIGK